MLFGLIETGEYHKWHKRRQNPNIPQEWVKGLNVLVVGVGSVGKRHLGNLQGLGVTKISAVDPREDRRIEVVERYGEMPTFATEEEAYAAGKYDVVVVANPPVFHVSSGTKAVQNGAHVLMEKNVSHQVEGAEEFLKLADKEKKVVAVAFIYRFYDTLQYIKSVIDAGTLGKIFSVQTTFSEYLPDWHPWEPPKSWYDSQKALGGSELYGENHTIDYSRWFFGEPVEVSGYVRRISDVTVDTDDLAEVMLVHETGVVTQIHLDMFGRKSRKDMWIMGEKGNIYWDSYMGGNRVEYSNGETKKSEVFMGKVSRNDAFTDFLVDFLECVKTGRTPVVSGWEALKTLKITALAEQSSNEGKRLKP